MAYLDSEANFVLAILDLIGEEGPVSLDTMILDHDLKLWRELRYLMEGKDVVQELAEEGNIVVGEEGKPITKDDLVELVLKARHYVDDMRGWESETCFRFEGIGHHEDDKRMLYIKWGS